ncbi:IS200/IS605 family transposase OrfB [Candidatus Mancarchaeum acidiphilum]|uniref:IS200/IS605 family transposase OrfB n=1 Tax=Candidatus Mancarchaeum acidiphilum TaxID=1920749 RepID=A0A218NMF6_9ARCH|nr:helix-turn-helix domain-containing protein [Candidatus Mancarchaeum acidiphilum]ASI13643.1 IS200/IS605 family transposase OrfB [Candidatus Mancarchaeum acidiphilum]
MNGYTNNMDSTRAYKFRIYPDTKRQSEIDERLILAQQFYNKILEKSIESYKNGKAKASIAQFNRFVKEIIQDDKRYLKLYSQTRCEIEYRLLKAYQNFFRRIKEGNRKAGFPRFRSRDINASINILKRATLGQRESHAQGESVRPQMEAVLEELRTDKTHPLQDAVTA